MKERGKNCEIILISYFFDMFASTKPTNVSNLCDIVKGKLSKAHKVWCDGNCTDLKVEEALH